MLQERIETLGSGILNFKENKVYIWGFNSIDRLNDYYFDNKKCHCCQGIYPKKDLNFGRTQDDALFILKKDNIEFKRYHFEVLFKEVVQYKHEISKNLTTKVYKIRKCKYTDIYNLILREKKKVNDEEMVFIESHNFESMDLLREFFFERFDAEIPLLLF